MVIHLIAIGTRMPPWVNEAYREYSKRLPAHCRLSLQEIPAGKRSKGADIGRLVKDEGDRLLAAIPERSWVVALERTGKQMTTEQLAADMQLRLASGADVALLVGGPEGLAEGSLQRADATWSLSDLTLAHPLVRVVVAEQLYRAWSIIERRPYHR